MAAGIIDVPIVDGLGITRTARFWSSTGLITGKLMPLSVFVDENEVPIPSNADTPVVNGATDLLVTSKSRQGPVQTATYSVSVLNLAVASGATDIFSLSGSDSAYVTLLDLSITGTLSGGDGIFDVQLLRRSSASSGGTLITAPTVVPTDSSFGAATAAVKGYTANPTALGTLTGPLSNGKLLLGKADGTGKAPNVVQLAPQNLLAAPLTIHGLLSGFLAVNWNSQAITGTALLNIRATWMEYTAP